MKSEELREKLQKETGIQMSDRQHRAILSLIKQGIEEAEPKERSEGILGILGTTHRDGVFNEGYNKGIADYKSNLLQMVEGKV